MADITMCTNKGCPNAPICYRVQAIPSEWQSMAWFDYTISGRDVECANYIQTVRIIVTNGTGGVK